MSNIRNAHGPLLMLGVKGHNAVGMEGRLSKRKCMYLGFIMETYVDISIALHEHLYFRFDMSR